AAATGRDDWRPTGHRLDHHHAERLVPLNGEDQAPCAGEQLTLHRGVRFTDVLHARAEPRLDLGFEVGLLQGLVALAGQDDAAPSTPGRVDRQVRALVRVEATKE